MGGGVESSVMGGEGGAENDLNGAFLSSLEAEVRKERLS